MNTFRLLLTGLFLLSVSSVATWADEEVGEKKLLSLELWNQMEAADQAEYVSNLDSDYLRDEYTGYEILSYSDTGDISDQVLKEKVEKFIEASLDEVSSEEIDQSLGQDTGLAVVGSDEVEIFLLTIPSEEGVKILASYAIIFQQGAYKENFADDDEYYYSDNESAEAAGFDPTADVSWQAHVSLNADMDLYEGSEEDAAYSWSGW